MKKFKVYQLPAEHAAKFMRLSFVKEHNIMPKLEDYKLVWEGEIEDKGESGTMLLDHIYVEFQGAKPADFKGHSLSMSDIVKVDGKYFYCDDFGWEEITFTSIKEEEAKRYGTTVESLEEQGFIFMEEACGDCHWFASCAELGGTLMSLAWYREQQKNFRNEHFKKDEEAKMIDLEENGNRCAGETPEMKVRIAEARRMKRYQEFKSKHPYAILLFRCGDFYETYYGDAITAAKVLGITLTHRRGFGKEKGHEMAGFPHHALDIYLPKLIRAGHRVAIVDE